MGVLVAWKAPQERAQAPTARAEVHAMVDRILDAVDTRIWPGSRTSDRAFGT